MHIGTVLWYDSGLGYGFVLDHGDNDQVFVTHEEVSAAGLASIQSGHEMIFDVTRGRRSAKVRRIVEVRRPDDRRIA